MKSEKYFDYRHLVTFHDTNIFGNVYFANYFLLQGLCREALMSQKYPEIVEDMKKGFGFATEFAHVDFQNEAFLFDNILIKMYVSDLSKVRIEFYFEYYNEEKQLLLATGRQAVVWVNAHHRPCLMPKKIHAVITEFFLEKA